MPYGTYGFGTRTYGEGETPFEVPTPPGFRLAYDDNGSRVIAYKGAIFTDLPPAAVADLNDEEWDAVEPDTILAVNAASIAIRLPFLFNIHGYFVSGEGITPGPLWVSNNTTDGHDGDWTIAENPWAVYDNIIPDYRLITPVSFTEVQGIRFAQTADGAKWRALHLYGEVVNNQHRLLPWHPTDSVTLSPAYFDFGQMDRGTEVTKDFRIYNASPTADFSSVAVSIEALSESLVDENLLISPDGGTTRYQVFNIGDLEPKQPSQVLTLVMNSPASGGALGLHSVRLRADPNGPASVPA